MGVVFSESTAEIRKLDLSPRCREAVLLRFIDRYELIDISDIMGVSVQCVSQYIARARATYPILSVYTDNRGRLRRLP